MKIEEHEHTGYIAFIIFFFILILNLFWSNWMQIQTINSLTRNSDNYYNKNFEKCLTEFKDAQGTMEENRDCFEWACSQFNMTNENMAINWLNGNIKCQKNGVSFYVSVNMNTDYYACQRYAYRQYLFERCYYEY